MNTDKIKKRCFNVAGACDPNRHYMVDIRQRLIEIKKMVDAGDYFTINRARQYGKTTTLKMLVKYLKTDYIVISLDFQRLGTGDFADENTFSKGFVQYMLRIVRSRTKPVEGFDQNILQKMEDASKTEGTFSIRYLFDFLMDLCATAAKPVVLIIDEVDSASNNQVFLDFLAQLRSYYLDRDNSPTFWSVILAGVYDVKNIRQKIRPNEEHKINSPWNIAADFEISLSLPAKGIAGMLGEYEEDHCTGMDINAMAGIIFSYTSGYPFLVSRLCKLIDEKVAGSEGFPDEKAAWTKEGFLEAEKMLLCEKNTLFESLMGKIHDDREIRQKIYQMLFGGDKVVFSPFDLSTDAVIMHGFAKNDNGIVKISNRIFETLLYDYFLTAGNIQSDKIFQAASQDKQSFVKNGCLDMEMVLQKYTEHFGQIYGDNTESFDEEEGRRRFLLYLRPIINGAGNYYIEAETRNARRMDVVVDYSGEQFIIELKIWRGNAYKERGEKQLADYLDYFHLKKGYLLSYNFNQKKEVGVKKIYIGDRELVEAVV